MADLVVFSIDNTPPNAAKPGLVSQRGHVVMSYKNGTCVEDPAPDSKMYIIKCTDLPVVSTLKYRAPYREVEDLTITLETEGYDTLVAKNYDFTEKLFSDSYAGAGTPYLDPSLITAKNPNGIMVVDLTGKDLQTKHKRRYKIMIDEFPQAYLDSLAATKVVAMLWAELGTYMKDEVTGNREL